MLPHLFDGGMQQAQFLLTGRPVHKGLLCDEAIHTSQKAVHSLYVVGAPDLQIMHIQRRSQHVQTDLHLTNVTEQ